MSTSLRTWSCTRQPDLLEPPASIEFDDVMARLQLVDVIRSYNLAVPAG